MFLRFWLRSVTSVLPSINPQQYLCLFLFVFLAFTRRAKKYKNIEENKGKQRGKRRRPPVWRLDFNGLPFHPQDLAATPTPRPAQPQLLVAGTGSALEGCFYNYSKRFSSFDWRNGGCPYPGPARILLSLLIPFSGLGIRFALSPGNKTARITTRTAAAQYGQQANLL